MARGRLISKSLSTSERYASLHVVAPALAEFCQSLFPLLIAHADDFGRLAGDAFTVKHMVLPTSPRVITDFASALAALDQVGLISWYECDGRKFIQVQRFDPHQPGLHKRTKSQHPDPPNSSGCFPEIPLEENRTEENRTEQKRDRSRAAVEGSFEVFWEAYPRKVNKQEARAVWLKLQPDQELLTRILAAIARQRQTPQWRNDEGRYIPHPRTWLHQGRWTDEDSAPQAGSAPAVSCRGRHKPPCQDDAVCTRKRREEDLQRALNDEEVSL